MRPVLSLMQSGLILFASSTFLFAEAVPTVLIPDSEATALALSQNNQGIPWGAYARTQRSLRPSLLEIIKSDSPVSVRANAIRMLGYIGDKDDIDMLISHYLRDKNEWKVGKAPVGVEVYSAIMDSLGIFSRRGEVVMAEDRIRSIVGENGFQGMEWHAEDVLKAKPEMRHAFIVVAVEGFALSGDKPRVAAMAKFASERLRAVNGEALSWRIEAKRLDDIYKINQEVERQGIRKIDREAIDASLLRNNPAKDSAVASPAGLTDDQIGLIIADALSVYAKCTAAFQEGDISKVAPYLSDNGRPWIDKGEPTAEDVSSAVGRLLRDPREIERQAAIIHDVLSSGTKMQPARLVKRQDLVAIESARGAGTYRMHFEEDMVINIELQGTADIVSKYKLKSSSSSVVEGGLRICFMRRYGRWMWLPFGW